MLRIISWNNGATARSLAQLISNGKLLLRDNTNPVPRNTGIINLGCSSIRRFDAESPDVVVLNRPSCVKVASSKLATFEALPSLVPPFWIDKQRAVFETLQSGGTLVCRTIDNGNSGAGIVTLSSEELLAGAEVPNAHVYVKGIQKRREYRVHVAFGRVVDVCRKVRRSGVPDENRPFVWNHDNEFIFQRAGVTVNSVPADVISKSLLAVRDLGLNFGAVDVIVERGGELATANVYVLEVNTSPGMEGRTLTRYAEVFTAWERGNLGAFQRWEDLPPFQPEESSSENSI